MEVQQLALQLNLWIAAMGLIFFVRWRRKVAGSGLLFAYVLNLWVNHWIAASLYVLPWYSYDWNAAWYRNFKFEWVTDGFQQSTFGIIAFVAGSFLIGSLFTPLLLSRQQGGAYLPDPRLPKAYIISGFIFYFLLSPVLGRLPTMASIISSGLSLMATGWALVLWKVWQERKRLAFYRWFAAGLLSFPLLTLVTQGFLSFGAIALVTVLAFVASFYRPRLRLIILAFLIGYLGLSFYVTYMRERITIREAVWGGRSLTGRVEQLYQSFSDFEWFDLYDQVHLARIDMRLNQNLLVGAAVSQLNGSKEFVQGETLLASLSALIPRVLWSDKPIFTGGSELASRFTGITYVEDTSVGIGPVMELYINFGTSGVIMGFLILGGIVTILDAMARERLLKGDWKGFTFWFLPGLSFIQISGSFVEVTASTGGAFIMAFLVNQLLNKFGGRKIFQKSV